MENTATPPSTDTLQASAEVHPYRYIVSRNYRDRYSPYKWLVRTVNQTTAQAVAYRHVSCQGVTFGPSSADENGFGCKIVAFVTDLTAEDPEPPRAAPAPEYAPGNLLFNGTDGFYLAGTGRYATIPSLASLTLTADGEMHAVLPEAAPGKSATPTWEPVAD